MPTDHPFEQAGLGLAPFRCVGMYENRYSPAPGYSQPGGTCDYCSNGILYCFQIRSSDGKEFVVGSDCVRKTTREGKFLDEVMRLKRDQEKKIRHEKNDAKRQKAWRNATGLYDRIMNNPDHVSVLQSAPHPHIPDKSLFDYLSWMRNNAGLSGLEHALNLADKEIKEAYNEEARHRAL